MLAHEQGATLSAVRLVCGLGRRRQDGRADLAPDKSFIVYPRTDRYPRASDVEVIGLRDMARMLGEAG